MVLLLVMSFAVAIVVVTIIVLSALQSVASTANALDESRSRQAVSGALETLRAQMATTLRDYSVWDDAARAVYAPHASEWITENFGLADTTGNIFDTAYLIGPDNTVIMGFRLGKPFPVVPAQYLSPAFTSMLKRVRAAKTGSDAEASGFVRTPEGIAIVGVSSVRPLSTGVMVPADRLQQLIFAKHLDKDKIDAIARTYVVPGLRLTTPSKVPQGAAVVRDADGVVIAGLTWDARAPGDLSYHNVRPYVLASVTITAAFVVFLLLVGSVVIDNLRKDEVVARKMALTDRLSGLRNRAGFAEALQVMIAGAREKKQQVMLLYLDMDGFKAVNDIYGHATGDRLLKSVSAGLAQLVSPDAVLARLGGDEFAIALPLPQGNRKPPPLGSFILEFFADPFVIGDRVVVVGVSVGTALSHLGAVEADELLRRADIAMYNAKASGRGRVIAYEEGMDADLAARKTMEAALREGIAKGELYVVYQPVVNAQSHAVVGLEALLRWQSSRLGMVSPEAFIPVAESSGLIDKLGLFVMQAALEVAQTYPAIGVSINVSPAQFLNPFFIPGVERLLEISGAAAQRVTLEVTEGYLIQNPLHARQTIEALTRLGVRIALDDFGAGFSSIGYLRQFAFDRLKLDRSMVVALDTDPRGPQILQATLALAAALEIPVTAEGIETKEQASILRLCGCDQLQGFLFSRPIALSALPALLDRPLTDVPCLQSA